MADELVIAFDLVGMLLDLSALDHTFQAEFGSSRVRQEWFAEVQKLMFSITAAGEYAGFSDIAEASLKIVEERHQQELSAMRRKQMLQSLRELPPFEDVKPSLERLRSSGFRLIVLTNSAEKAAKQAIESAGFMSALCEWMTAAEAAAYLRTKPRTLLKWVREGSIKAWPLHGAKRRTWRFRKEDLDSALGFGLPILCYRHQRHLSLCNEGELHEKSGKICRR